jgi:hypothetical protein
MYVGNPQVKSATAGAAASVVTFAGGARGMTIFNTTADTCEVALPSGDIAAGKGMPIAASARRTFPVDVEFPSIEIIRTGVGDCTLKILYYGSEEGAGLAGGRT